jgi:hypothetical protein
VAAQTHIIWARRSPRQLKSLAAAPVPHLPTPHCVLNRLVSEPSNAPTIAPQPTPKKVSQRVAHNPIVSAI